MRPDGHAAANRLRGLDHFCAAEFFVTVAREPGKDEVTLLIADDDTVAVRHEERIPPSVGTRGVVRFPYDFSRFGVEATQLAIAADAVDAILGHDRGTHDSVQ